MSTQQRIVKAYLVHGPGGVEWSIWDHGCELVVCNGPLMTDRAVARVIDSHRLSDAGRSEQIIAAASAIHVAKLGGWDEPIFHKLWRAA